MLQQGPQIQSLPRSLRGEPRLERSLASLHLWRWWRFLR